ncbi:sulfite exporter TauE/SafE family protein [Dongshaea marina]|uniref:sulfite exporter TauE/SafE family protein n=1 Tax=Dongshaea marina TaxID=2047966 RepID=UPI000D3E5B87|nr:sulfite exporter TauE/SafE family protein [Dongshaea marina]
MPDPQLLLIASLITLLGAFIQSAIGFGMAIVAAPVLFYLDPQLIPAPLICAALASCALNIWRFRHALSMKGLYCAIGWRIPGTIVGGLLLTVVSQRMLGLMIALMIGIGVAISLLRLSVKATPLNMGIAGFLSGVMGTSTSIGGPPMALVMQSEQANAIRANLASFFFISCVLSLLMLSYTGHFDGKLALWGLALIPPALLGNALAYLVVERISPKLLHYATISLCSIAMISILVQSA